MKIRIFILLLMTFEIFLGIYAQPRINTEYNVFIEKTSPSITSIVGWKYNDAIKRWGGWYNCIDETTQPGKEKQPVKETKKNMSFVKNMLSLRTRKIKFNNTDYYIVSYTKLNHVYEYPSIKVGLEIFKEAVFIIMRPIDYLNFISPTEEVKTINCHFITEYILEGNDMLFELGKGIDRYRDDIVNDNFYSEFDIKLEAGKFVRITPFFEFKKDISTMYYEIPITEFNKLIIK